MGSTALPFYHLALCLIQHRILTHSDWIKLEQSGIKKIALMYLGFINQCAPLSHPARVHIDNGKWQK